MVLAADLDDVGGVSSARTFGVEGVDRTALHGGNGVFHEPGLVQSVSVDHHLHVHCIRHGTGSNRWRQVLCPSLRAISGRRPQLRPVPLDAAGRDALPLPAKARFIGKASAACNIRPICQGPGVHVVARVPCAGPVPPPSIVVRPECSASSICCGQMK